MDKNSLIMIIIILIAGIGVTFYFKKIKNSEANEPNQQQQWNDWDKQSETEKLPHQDQPPMEKRSAPKSYAEAIQLAKLSGDDVFLFFTADWCSNCMKMKKEALADPKVQEMLSHYIRYEVNVDNERELAKKYKVLSVPNYKIVDGDERVQKSGLGQKSTDKFIAWLQDESLLQRIRH